MDNFEHVLAVLFLGVAITIGLFFIGPAIAAISSTLCIGALVFSFFQPAPRFLKELLPSYGRVILTVVFLTLLVVSSCAILKRIRQNSINNEFVANFEKHIEDENLDTAKRMLPKINAINDCEEEKNRLKKTLNEHFDKLHLKNANEFIEKRKYEKAKEELLKIPKGTSLQDEVNNSVNMIKKGMIDDAYQAALVLIENKEYMEVAKVLEQLSGKHEKAIDKLKEIDFDLKEMQFAAANQLMKEKDYEHALSLFRKLGSYRNSKQLSNKALNLYDKQFNFLQYEKNINETENHIKTIKKLLALGADITVTMSSISSAKNSLENAELYKKSKESMKLRRVIEKLEKEMNKTFNKWQKEESVRYEAESKRLLKGQKPENNSWDGSVSCVKYPLKRMLKDPGSFKPIEWSYVIDMDTHWAVRVKYRAKNSFGAYTIEHQLVRFVNPNNSRTNCQIIGMDELY